MALQIDRIENLLSEMTYYIKEVIPGKQLVCSALDPNGGSRCNWVESSK